MTQVSMGFGRSLFFRRLWEICADGIGALNAEMGLKAVDPDLTAANGGAHVVTPSGIVLDGSVDAVEAPLAGPHEAPTAVVDFLEFYLLNYFKPGTEARGIFTHFKSSKRTS